MKQSMSLERAYKQIILIQYIAGLPSDEQNIVKEFIRYLSNQKKYKDNRCKCCGATI